jgi:hypothetical protein
VVAVGVGAAQLDHVLQWLSRYPMFASFAGRDFVMSDSSVRGVMWSCAWEHVQPVLWTGHGYASWLRVAGAACPDTPFIYDTAHNLWVQMLFELGLLHGLLVVGAAIWFMVHVVLVRRDRTIDVEAAALGVVPVLLLVTVVQELDYVPAVYYGAAAILGVIWGGSRVPAGPGFPSGTSGVTEGVASRRTAWVLAGTGSVVLVLAVAYLQTISWGGYTYVPVNEPGFQFERWFRPSGVLATPASKYPYSVFPFAAPMYGRIEVDDGHGDELTVTDTGFVLANGHGAVARQHRYHATTRTKWLSRLNAFSVYLPPLASDFRLHAESGVSVWEAAADGVAEKRCGLACSVDVGAAMRPGETRALWAYVEQPCTAINRRAIVRYSVDVLRRGRFTRDREGELVFGAPLEVQPIELQAGDAVPDLWRVSLVTVPACAEEMPARGRSGSEYAGVRLRFAAAGKDAR